MQPPQQPHQQGHAQYGAAQAQRHAYHARASKKSTFNPMLLIPIMMAGAIALAVIAAIVQHKFIGDSVYVHNDRESDATITLGDKTWEIEPGQWVEANMPPDADPTMRVSFADGATTEILVDAGAPDCYRQYLAYSLRGRACYAMLDISAIYGVGDLVRVENVYRGRQNLEFGAKCDDAPAQAADGSSRSEVEFLHPGEELEKKVYLSAGEKVFRLFQVGCEHGAVEELVAALNPS